MSNAFKCDVCGKFFELLPLNNFIGGSQKIEVQPNLRLFMFDRNEEKACDFEQWDLCPECYKRLRDFLQPGNENLENVQSENNTDCFEKEMTKAEAFKLMYDTWCCKCKGLNKNGVCKKPLPRSGITCLDAVMSNEIPEAFEENILEENENEY